MARPGRNAVVTASVGGSTLTLNGRPGYAGFEYTVDRSERQTPGAGPIEHQLTDNDEGTFAFTVDDDKDVRALLWRAGGQIMTVNYTPPGGSEVPIKGVVDVTVNLQANDAVQFSVAGVITEPPG